MMTWLWSLVGKGNYWENPPPPYAEPYIEDFEDGKVKPRWLFSYQGGVHLGYNFVDNQDFEDEIADGWDFSLRGGLHLGYNFVDKQDFEDSSSDGWGSFAVRQDAWPRDGSSIPIYPYLFPAAPSTMEAYAPFGVSTSWVWFKWLIPASPTWGTCYGNNESGFAIGSDPVAAAKHASHLIYSFDDHAILLLIKISAGLSSYTGSTSGGITSLNHGPSSATFWIEDSVVISDPDMLATPP